jgi:antitoxin component YwqK of YwqJK toxin-antitoxin module
MVDKYFFDENKLIIKDDDLKINLSSNLKIELKYIFYSKGNIKAKMHYHKNDLHGPSSFFDEDNNLISISWFYLNKKVGKSYKYYKSKKIYSIEQYIDDKLDGKQKYFYENKNLRSLLFYNKGSLNKALLYHKNKKLKKELIFTNGKFLKNSIFDDLENEIKEEIFRL